MGCFAFAGERNINTKHINWLNIADRKVIDCSMMNFEKNE